jgi:hypothetical protein
VHVTQKLTRGLPQQHAYTQVLRHATGTDTCNDPAIYMDTTSGELYYSLDHGDAWKPLHTNLPRIFSVEPAVA